ncbi:MAG: hypothetical protein LBP76_00760, partial [Treponema sp.]|nr:hypothetical protein [Treponema sp.]
YKELPGRGFMHPPVSPLVLHGYCRAYVGIVEAWKMKGGGSGGQYIGSARAVRGWCEGGARAIRRRALPI